jgi:hypothetical protein
MMFSTTFILEAKEGVFDALFFLRLSEGGERWDREECRKISLMESNAKCRYLKKLTSTGDFAAGVYLSEAQSPS